MFPDSQIVKSYKQKTDMAKYTLQFGITPWFWNIMLKELKNRPLLLRFDESTHSQIKTQYDVHATYHSRHFGQTVTAYLGTLFVRRCTADDLLYHLSISMNCLKRLT